MMIRPYSLLKFQATEMLLPFSKLQTEAVNNDSKFQNRQIVLQEWQFKKSELLNKLWKRREKRLCLMRVKLIMLMREISH